MSDDTTLFLRNGPVARITLNAPARHNALGVTEIRRLRELGERDTRSQLPLLPEDP